MPGVFFNEEETVEVGEVWLDRLKKEARDSPRDRARLCLHMSTEDSVQEMLIVFAQGALLRPHRSLNKSESFHVVEGDLRMVLFDDNGAVTRTIDMGPPGSGKAFMARLSSSPWYTYIPQSSFLVLHEITRGPFDSNDTEFPEWAPEEGPDLKSFLDKVSAGGEPATT